MRCVNVLNLFEFIVTKHIRLYIFVDVTLGF